MAKLALFFFGLQVVLLNEALALPSILSPYNLQNAANAIQANGMPSVLNGVASQIVAPEFIANWPTCAQSVPLVTEIVPNLQFGEINVDGDMPVGGMIKISGTFPVFGNIAVDGTVPSYGTAYVDTANIFQADCN